MTTATAWIPLLPLPPILAIVFYQINVNDNPSHNAVFIAAIASMLLTCISILCQLDANITVFLAELYIQYRPSLLHRTFNDKVTLIAGASDGIGAETARQLCQKTNASIILLARTQSKLEKVQAECEAISKQYNTKATVTIAAGDVTKGETHLSDLIQKALAQLNKTHVHTVIISAGRAYERSIDKTEMDLIRSTFEINVFGAISTVKAFLSHTCTTSSSPKNVILISSLVGKMPTALAAGYSSSKAASQLFFDTLRAEYESQNIRVTTVCPGPVHTNIFEASAAAMGETLDEELKASLHKMMSAERAVQLMLAGCVAQPFWMFFEVWIVQQPLLLFTYINHFFPGVIKHFASARMKQKRKW